jgi:ATP-dependent DNA helicase PIF1
LAACNIEGVTLHSFSGIALGKDPVEDLIKRIKRNRVNVQRWRRTKILVIDEISMVDGELFDKLEQIARTLRNNGRPFGGIQLVITGDFFQLPPVGENGRQAKFAFEAGTWDTSIDHTIGLHQVFRQKDPVFAEILNEMREGRMSKKSIETFKRLSRPLPAMAESIEATELYPTRAEVDRANSARMQQLHGRAFEFPSRDGGTISDPQRRENMLQKFLAPSLLVLKKGAQVMLTKNMDEMLVNGSLGKVIGFMTEQMFEVYKDNEEDFLEGRVPGLGDDDLSAQQSASLLGLSTQKLYPLVRFANPDGTTRELLCKPEVSKTEQPNGEVLVSREQIPLILAWALSIHKAQGQTLERVKVDLGKAFEKGQAYVALSRATHMEGLQVTRFDVSKVQCHDKVKAFYRSLSTAEQVSEKAKEKSILSKLTKPSAKSYEEAFVAK